MRRNLSPCSSPFLRWEIAAAFHLKVAECLLPTIPEFPIAAATICLPSFDKEWAVCIREHKVSGFVLVLTEPSGHLSITPKSEIHVETCEVELSSPVAQNIFEIWRKVLLTVAYDPEGPVVSDGISFHFLYNREHISGSAVSPPPGTHSGHLASLSLKLREYARSKDQKTFTAQLESELEWFRKFPSRPPFQDDAAVQMRKDIERIAKIHEEGNLKDVELAQLVAHVFRRVQYPPIGELIDTIDLIPEKLRDFLRSERMKEMGRRDERNGTQLID